MEVLKVQPSDLDLSVFSPPRTKSGPSQCSGSDPAQRKERSFLLLCLASERGGRLILRVNNISERRIWETYKKKEEHRRGEGQKNKPLLKASWWGDETRDRRESHSKQSAEALRFSVLVHQTGKDEGLLERSHIRRFYIYQKANLSTKILGRSFLNLH